MLRPAKPTRREPRCPAPRRPRCIVPLGDAVWSPDRALLAHCNRAVSHATTTATPMRMVTMAIATLLLFCLMLYTASLLGCKAMPADGICDGSATICSRSVLGAGAAGGGAGGSSSSTVMTRSSLRGPSGHASGDARRPTKGFSHCSLPTAARIGCERIESFSVVIMPLSQRSCHLVKRYRALRRTGAMPHQV